MTELGSIVQLTAGNEDDDGNLVDPAVGPTLTVTQPDGTTAAPAVVHDGTGQWHADFVTAQAGRHVARWVGTGTNAFAFVEAFTVDALDNGMLFSLAAAKKAVRLSKTSTAHNDELLEFVAAVTPIIEDIVGPIVPRPCDEWYDGGWSSIVLLTTPVKSITSVTESWGAGTTRILLEQVLDGAGPFDTYGYTIDKTSGTLTRRVSGVASAFAGGRRNIHVVYVAGQPVAPNVLLAAKEQLRFLWQFARQSTHPGMANDDTEVEYTDAGYAVPRRVIELCAGQLRGPGIA